MNYKNTEESNRGQHERTVHQPHEQIMINEGTGPRAPRKGE